MANNENNIVGGEKMKFLRLIVFCVAVLMIIPTFSVNAVNNYWYVKRNAEHKQPICDSSLEYIEDLGAIYVDRGHGDEQNEKVIYLTFDAGYENGNIGKILDVLSEEGVKGSFFILENLIGRAPELVKRMASEGHCVANHTKKHKKLINSTFEEVRDEIIGLEEQYKALTGREMSKFFRPPEGVFDKELLKQVNELGYKTVFWSFAYADWDNDRQMSEQAAMDIIMKNIHNGEIMLLHPTSETNAQIMKKLIKELKAQGFRFATLDEL